MKEDKGRTPLRIILNNFLNHIEKLESLRSPDDSYEKEFQELKLFSENLKGHKQYLSGEGEKDVNRKKNRYKDILPFDFSRVVLSEYAGTAGSDYINANFIRGASGSPAYIASQGPLPHTANDFWRMVVECEVHVIIMACNEDEAGKHKCEKYWVDREGEVKQFGMVRIRLIQGSDVCPDFSVRTIKLEYTTKESTTEERTVCQFHYSAWPDHGVPPSVRPLLDMVRLVRDTQASETLPVLVHCSAGCGRTGTICAIDYVWGLLRAGKLTKDFSLLALVREMRRQRVAMVQTTEQYILVHRAVRELFKEQLRVIDSHPYENIDVDGALVRNKTDEEPLYELVRTFEEPKRMGNCSSKKSLPAGDSSPAPPLPRKNRIHMAASKHEKEVENQTQKQRNSQGGPMGIAKLKAMFERSPVSRSQSLGRRQASNPVPVVSPPCPALPIKRSKSLRIVGERNRLSIIAHQAAHITATNGSSKSKPPTARNKAMPGVLLRRRRSFESDSSPKPMRHSLHLDDDGRKLLQDCKDFLSRSVDSSAGDVGCQRVEGIVGGKGIRERRDSFRQAISKKSDPVDKISSNAMTRHHTPQRNHDVPDEVDGPMIHQLRYKTNSVDHDEVDASQSNVIIVKPDRSSPKVDLYVKGLSGEGASSNGNRQLENGSDPLKQIGLIWNRAATSIDLKTNLRNGDLSLQELKSCLRREGTAHELKARKMESIQNSVPVKPYKSLDRVPKKDEVSAAPSEWRPPVISNAIGSPHRSPQTTVDRRNPLTVPSSPHRSPQTTVDRRNPIPNMSLSSPQRSPQTTVDRRHPMQSSSSPHRSPQTTFDRRNALTSPHQSPQATVDRRNPLSSHTSPHSSPQTTVDRRNPLSATASPHHSPQTTVDRRNPLSSHSSPHQSPQTTVDRRNHVNQLSSVLMSAEILPANARNHIGTTQHSPQTTVDRRGSSTSAHVSPQTTVDRRAPLSVSASPHVSPQTTVDRRNVILSVPPPMPQLQMLLSASQMNHSPLPAPASGNHAKPHPGSLPLNGNGLLRPSMAIEHQPRVSNGQQVQHRPNLHHPAASSFDKPAEPYSYGLVASVLRRGSQDDLALCASGNSVVDPKVATSSQRPSAPPRIKRHASVVLPRKSAGNKESSGVSNSSTPVDPKRWAARSGQAASPRKVMALPPGPLPPTVPPPSISAAPPQPVVTSPTLSKDVSNQQVSGSSKSRTSPKKSAASSLSRALGALQLRRSGNSSSATTAVPKSGGDETGSATQRPSPKSSPANKTPSFPAGLLAPTMVINPGKTILPPGIMDDGKPHATAQDHLLRSAPSFPMGPTHQTQSIYPLPPHTRPRPLLHPHPHPHSHSHPSSQPPQRPPHQPFQHRHPFSPQRHVPPSPPHHVYPQLSHQHPKTHKKQQYL